MRKVILSLLAVLMLMSCAQKYYDQNGNELSKEQMEALRTNEVKQRLHDRHYKVLVDMMSPNRFMPRTLVHEWGISIHNDTIDCYRLTSEGPTIFLTAEDWDLISLPG